MTALGRNQGIGRKAPSGRLTPGRLPMILMYHGVADVTEDPNQLCVTPGRFAEQMATLQRLGLRGVSMGTLVDAMRRGRQRGLVGITFDDGYLSVLEAALPELRRRGFTASVFIISDRLGGTNEWDEGQRGRCSPATRWRELAAAGHGDRLPRRHAHAAAQACRRPARSGDQREQGPPWRARRRPRPGLRLSLRLDGCGGPAGGPRRGLRLRLRRADADGRTRAHGAAQDLRRSATTAPPG